MINGLYKNTHTSAACMSHDCSSVILCWLLFHLIYFWALFLLNLLDQQQSKHYKFCICAGTLHYISLLYYYYIFSLRYHSKISHGNMEILFLTAALCNPPPQSEQIPCWARTSQSYFLLPSWTVMIWFGWCIGPEETLLSAGCCCCGVWQPAWTERVDVAACVCVILLFWSSCFSLCDSYITFLHDATLWWTDKSKDVLMQLFFSFTGKNKLQSVRHKASCEYFVSGLSYLRQVEKFNFILDIIILLFRVTLIVATGTASTSSPHLNISPRLMLFIFHLFSAAALLFRLCLVQSI